MASRQSQIRNIFTTTFSDLFEPETLGQLKIKQDSSGRQLWIPDQLHIDDHGGVPLREGVGFIRIQETLNRDEVVAYIYAFFSDEYIFTSERTGSTETTDEGRIFAFHYDREENDEPYGPHISVVYPGLRYISKNISLEDFLAFIRDHFFDPGAKNLVKKSSAIWVNRR